MDEVTITLPAYAVRYLVGMCERERQALSDMVAETGLHSLGADASYDSINAIECAIPSSFDPTP